MADPLDDIRVSLSDIENAVREARDRLTEVEMEIAASEQEVDDLREFYESEGGEVAERVASAWDLAARLHDEAHSHDRTPFVFCRRQTCTDLKDRLHPGWREHRPATYPVAV